MRARNYITCRGCHSLDAFGGPRSQMNVLIHKDVIKANDVNCLQCHRDVGHVYEQPVAKTGGWYTAKQAEAGGKLYQAQCGTCPRCETGRRLWAGAERSVVAPDVWRRKAIDGVGRNQRPDGPICGRDLHNTAVAGYSVLPAATKRAAFGEPAACGYARAGRCIAGEIEMVGAAERKTD
jgi:hypothetical protein